jgi:hypothetical protein
MGPYRGIARHNRNFLIALIEVARLDPDHGFWLIDFSDEHHRAQTGSASPNNARLCYLAALADDET